MTACSRYPTPRALETEEIAGVVAQFRHGARARQGGRLRRRRDPRRQRLPDRPVPARRHQPAHRPLRRQRREPRALPARGDRGRGRASGARPGRRAPLAARRLQRHVRQRSRQPPSALPSRRWTASAWPTCIWSSSSARPLTRRSSGAASRHPRALARPLHRQRRLRRRARRRGGGLGLGHGRRLRRAVHRQSRPAVAPARPAPSSTQPDKDTFYGGDERAMSTTRPWPRSGSRPDAGPGRCARRRPPPRINLAPRRRQTAQGVVEQGVGEARVERRVADQQTIVERAVDQVERDLEVEALAQIAARRPPAPAAPGPPRGSPR